MRLELSASDHFIPVVHRDHKAFPIQTHWVDPNGMDQAAYLRRLGFTCRANGSHLVSTLSVSGHTSPAATIIMNVAMNQWIKNGQTKDLVRYATQPKANPPKMVDNVSTSGLLICAIANGTA